MKQQYPIRGVNDSALSPSDPKNGISANDISAQLDDSMIDPSMITPMMQLFKNNPGQQNNSYNDDEYGNGQDEGGMG